MGERPDVPRQGSFRSWTGSSHALVFCASSSFSSAAGEHAFAIEAIPRFAKTAPTGLPGRGGSFENADAMEPESPRRGDP